MTGSAPPRVLAVSCYELGHQPQHLAVATAVLRAAGMEVRCADLAVEALDDGDVAWADTVAVAVQMHTAARLAADVVARIRGRRGDDVRIVLYGLYAGQAMATFPAGSVDAAVAGEFEEELVRLAAGAAPGRTVVLDRVRSRLPERDLLPPPGRYARLLVDGEERLAGHVESTRGCVHRCRHCPVPVVYDGRIRIVDAGVVAEDAARQWAAGVRHLSFGDPDFLNAVPHALRTARAMHDRLPDATFDVTTKVEHVLEHAAVWAELRSLGLLFVVSAVESTSDEVLRILAKGHRHGDTLAALRLLRSHGIEMRPSLLPFTPWSDLPSYLDLLDFVAAEDLVDSVDPVQLSIRLLLPEGSLLLGVPEMLPHLTGTHDPSGHAWRHPDPRMDALAAAAGAICAAGADAGAAAAETHRRIREAAAVAAREEGVAWAERAPARREAAAWLPAERRPHLSEPWFCCAEPTAAQSAGARAAAASGAPAARANPVAS